MAWWSRTQGLAAEPKKSVPKGIWTKCERCSTTLYEADLDANFRVCSNCQHHFRMPTEGRIQMIVDDDKWQELDRDLESSDPLGFRVDGKKYIDQVKATARKVGPGDAYRAGTAAVGGIAVVRRGGEDHPPVRARCHPPPAGGRVLRLGRGAHAGGRAVADADGQDIGGAQPAARGQGALHLGAAPPYHRRCRGVGR